MIRKALILSVFCCFTSLFGQENSPVAYSSLFGLNAARYEPAVLGNDFNKYYVNILNSYVWAGNTTFSRQQIEDLANGETENLNTFFNNLKDNNHVGFGTLTSLLNVGVKIKKDGEELFTFRLGVTDRLEANMVFSNEIFRTAWGGNAQYEDQEIDLHVSANAYYVREYVLGFAMPLPVSIDNWGFKGGLSFKYLQGMAAFHTETMDASLYTAPNGEYLDLYYDYNVSMSYDENMINGEGVNLTNPYGNGFATDIGVSASFKERFYGNLNVLDIGGVTYKKNVTNYQNTGTLRYDGVFVENIFKGPYDFDGEEFEEIYEDAETKGGKFTMPYPTRLRTHFSYRIPKENKKGVTYYVHNIGLTYIQGFKNFGTATTRPYLAGSYTFNLKSSLEAGTIVGFNGYNKAEIGLYLGFRAGIFRFGLGSGNLTAIFKKFGTGADFNFNISIAN